MRTSRILERDGNKCFLCSEYMNVGDRTIEHIVPKALGGTNYLNNTALTHSYCNRKRGTLPVAVYRSYLAYKKNCDAQSLMCKSWRKFLHDKGFQHNEKTHQWDRVHYEEIFLADEELLRNEKRDRVISDSPESPTPALVGVASRPVAPPKYRAVSTSSEWKGLRDMHCRKCYTQDDVDVYPPYGALCYTHWRLEERLDSPSRKRAIM